MDGQNYVLFHNAADDSYMNTTANFRGAYATAQAVDIYFESPISSTTETGGAYDKITCACTDGEEDRALEQLAAAMAGSGPKGRAQTIVDDVNNVYACQDITSVTTIATANSGSTRNVITLTDDRTLTSGESGSMVVMNHATKVITLPTAAAGLWYDIVLLQDTDAAFTIVAGASDSVFGNIQVISTTDNKCSAVSITHATSTGTVASYDNIDLDHDVTTLGGKAGDVIRVTAVDATAWLVQTTLTMDGNPSSGAVINAG